jgi:hypothetical protein
VGVPVLADLVSLDGLLERLKSATGDVHLATVLGQGRGRHKPESGAAAGDCDAKLSEMFMPATRPTCPTRPTSDSPTATQPETLKRLAAERALLPETESNRALADMVAMK